MTKNRKLTIIIATALLVIAGIAAIATTQLNKTPTPPIAPAVTQSSTSPSSEPTSSDFEVPEIAPPEPIVTSSAPESKKAELTVTGSPDGKVSSTQPKPAEKPKPTESKPVSSVAPKPAATPKPSKPTGDGDVYDERTNGYPKLGDTIIDSFDGGTLTWKANIGFAGEPGWIDLNPPDLPDVSAGNDKAFQDSYVCSKCGGSWDTCNCTLELAD